MKNRPGSVRFGRISRDFSFLLRSAALGAFTLLMCSMLSGCIVAGVSSSGGAFIWPGGLGLLVIVLAVLFLMRRR